MLGKLEWENLKKKKKQDETAETKQFRTLWPFKRIMGPQPKVSLLRTQTHCEKQVQTPKVEGQIRTGRMENNGNNTFFAEKETCLSKSKLSFPP